MLQKIILFIAVVTVYQNSNAAYIIEPSIGYRQESIKFTDLTNTSTDLKVNSPIYGLKLGVTLLGGISFDLAGSRSSGKAQFTPAITEQPDYSHNLGTFQVGVNAMGILKIYLGYILLDEFEVQTNTSVQGFKMKGSGFQAGIMTFPFSRLGIGAQYNVHQFKEISGASYTLGSDVKNYYQKIDVQDLALSLSVLF